MQAKIMRRREVEKTIGLSRSSIYSMMAVGEFPKPIRLGKRAVGWQQSDIETWLSERPHSQGNG